MLFPPPLLGHSLLLLLVAACVCVLLVPVKRVVVSVVLYADLCFDVPIDFRNGGRAEKVAKSRVA